MANKKKKNKEARQARFVFTRESLKKKFRLSEYLAEKVVSSVAFLTITVIVLIFFFVFKESLGVFELEPKNDHVSKGTQVETQQTYGTESGAADQQETYGGATDEPAQQETYGGATDEPQQQETYGGATDEPQQQETYGELTDSSASGDALPELGVSESKESLEAQNDNRAALKSLNGPDWLPVSDRPRYGLWPLILGTLKLTLIAILFAAPIAIMAALYSSTFAPSWARETIKPAIELLAGFPSVVIGFFALMVMATLFQDLLGYSSRLNSFVGGIALALAAIPIIYTITEDALSAIPASYKEASLALGATKWQTAFNVVLPAATPGIFAAVLLGIGRIFGETMIALMATGNAAMISANPFDSVRTISATIGAEMAEVVFGDTHYSILFLLGSMLFLFTFAINSIAEFYVKGKLMKRIQGK
jgi:phosphate transport system permease protein